MCPRYDHEDQDGLRLGKAAPAEKHSANCGGDENYSGTGFDGGDRDILLIAKGYRREEHLEVAENLAL